MKQRLFHSIILCLMVYSTASAEEVLSRRLSVTFRETPLKQALEEVAKLADFEWSYNADLLEADRRVTLVARDWTVREVLREILGEGFAYKSSGKYLILKKQNPPKSELSGVIRDPKTGERLAHVTVYDRKTLRATTTDSSGYYNLKVKNQAEIVVARLGYRDTFLQVTSMTPRYQKIELSQVPIPPTDSALPSQKLRQSIQQTTSQLDLFFAATLDKWHDLNIPDTLHRRFQISFLPMLGTNHILSRKVVNDLSINILAGQSAGVQGAEFAGLGNFTKKQVTGVQAAGLFNVNRGNCRGVQAAGIFNQTADTLTGVQLAGLVNVARYSPRLFVQASGLVNIIRKNESVEGDTTAPKGIQLAGLVNKTDNLEGIQAAGLINHANHVEGVQAAGLVNNAHRIRGLQIGLINSANELHGLQIGLINRSGKRWLPIVNWGK